MAMCVSERPGLKGSSKTLATVMSAGRCGVKEVLKTCFGRAEADHKELWMSTVLVPQRQDVPRAAPEMLMKPLRCGNYCCNPDNDVAGAWCFVEDKAHGALGGFETGPGVSR